MKVRFPACTSLLWGLVDYVEVEQWTAEIDVTSFGDVAQRYARGTTSTTIRLVAERVALDPEIEFDETVEAGHDAFRLRGRALVRNIAPLADGRVEVELEATGPVQIVRVDPTTAAIRRRVAEIRSKGAA